MTREEFYNLTDILNTEVLGNFMHGGEADELIAMFEEAVEHSNILEVKEVDLAKERMSECPYRQVGCTMYKGKILECNGACSWVVDYPRLKELKTQKGEEV